MVYCSPVNCKSNTNPRNKEEKFDVSFYRLPRDNHLKKAWLANLKRDNPPIEQNIRIFHLHFNDECFERYLKV